MSKALVVEAEKCNGCRLCVKACSLRHGGSEEPERSRIRVEEFSGIFMPVVCQQCEDAPCIACCPTSSRSRDESSGKTNVDYERCIVCKTCIAVCPFGASRYDKTEKRVVTCDLCEGNPECVKVCEPGALKYVEKRDINVGRQVEAAEKLCVVLVPRGRNGARV